MRKDRAPLNIVDDRTVEQKKADGDYRATVYLIERECDDGIEYLRHQDEFPRLTPEWTMRRSKAHRFPTRDEAHSFAESHPLYFTETTSANWVGNWAIDEHDLPNQTETAEPEFAANKIPFYKEIDSDIWRIVSLVQQNPEFFGGIETLGRSCIKVAADKMESLIKQNES